MHAKCLLPAEKNRIEVGENSEKIDTRQERKGHKLRHKGNKIWQERLWQRRAKGTKYANDDDDDHHRRLKGTVLPIMVTI